MRIGCLGASRIAPRALVEPARRIGGITLTVIGARDAKRARAFAETHGFEQSGDYDAVIADRATTLVYIALPVHQHAGWSIRALEAGKHVLCEKPFAMNSDEAMRVLDAAQAANRRVIEAFHNRYHPAFEQMLGWISSGRIGKVRRIEAEFCAPIDARGGAEIRHLPECGGGAFMDLGCYPLNFALAITNSAPVSVEARASLTPRGVDEVMEARLVFEDGVEAALRASMALDAPVKILLRVIGEDGEIEFKNPVVPQLGAECRLTSSSGAEAPDVDRTPTYFFQLRRVVEALGSGCLLPTEAGAILRQQGVLDSVYKAAGLGDLRVVCRP